MRLVQHKKEAYWFYRFLSIFYDKLVNPLFWTERMRDLSLELADLEEEGIEVIDVGSGTGFTTEGIVQQVSPERVTCVDQSPHQMQHAHKKPELQGCTFKLGDAENLPFPDDHFDRYVSAGSIEYWPNPQQGVLESYRVIKPGGLALLIGPLEPANPLGRFIARLWMLFPKEEEYRQWYEQAGFTDIQTRFVRPQWSEGKGKYGIALVGRKPAPGPSPLSATYRPEPEPPMTLWRWVKLIGRVLIGSLAGFLFIPAALFGYLRRSLSGKEAPEGYREGLNRYQIIALLGIILILILLIAFAC